MFINVAFETDLFEHKNAPIFLHKFPQCLVSK